MRRPYGLTIPPGNRARVIERLRRLSKPLTSGCRLWIGATRAQGTASFAVNTDLRAAPHYVAYALAHGNLPADVRLVRLCKVPNCLTPEHYAVRPWRKPHPPKRMPRPTPEQIERTRLLA